MEAHVKYKFTLQNLNCAGCAGKIESDLIQSEFVELAALNFASKQLIIKPKTAMQEEAVRQEVDLIVKKYEKDVDVISINSKADKGNASKAALIEKLEKASLGLGTVLFGLGLWASFQEAYPQGISLGLFILAYLLIGGEVLVSAFRNILRGSWFDEQFLMAIATFSAWGIGEYPEAVAVMLFYRVGELFEEYAVNKSRKTIEGLVDIKENTTHVLDEFLQVKDMATDFVRVGTLILVRPGERIPLDGKIEDGQSNLDVSALTGESVPVEAKVGDVVFSGAINQNGVLKIRTTADFENSMVGKILDLIENAGGRKAETEKFITKFAKYYTPAVVFTALAIGVIPPFFTGMNFGQWLYRASIFLVVSCPCALVISVPLGYFGGIGKASKYGILVKGGNYLEALTRVDTVLMDKTGTITEGKFSVSSVQTVGGVLESELLEVAVSLESLSNHPIAKSVVDYATEKGYVAKAITAYEEIAGKGVKGSISEANGETIVYAGNDKLLLDLGLAVPDVKEMGSVVFVVAQQKYLGYVVVADNVKASSAQAMKLLKAAGIKEIIMLTGDKKAVGEAVAKAVGVDTAHTELLPHEKVAQIELSKKTAKGVVFVGDGLNDAPALALADVGVAMGGMGADLSIEAADVVIMNDDLVKLAEAIKIAKGTQRIIVQNIVFALGVKAIVLVLGAIGIATMWEAVFADVGVALLAIMNSMRNNA
jgi:Cd2+/Zn2+-exporting ATPase